MRRAVTWSMDKASGRPVRKKKKEPCVWQTRAPTPPVLAIPLRHSLDHHQSIQQIATCLSQTVVGRQNHHLDVELLGAEVKPAQENAEILGPLPIQKCFELLDQHKQCGAGPYDTQSRQASTRGLQLAILEYYNRITTSGRMKTWFYLLLLLGLQLLRLFRSELFLQPRRVQVSVAHLDQVPPESRLQLIVGHLISQKL